MNDFAITVYRDSLVEMLKDEGFPVDQIPIFLTAFSQLKLMVKTLSKSTLNGQCSQTTTTHALFKS